MRKVEREKLISDRVRAIGKATVSELSELLDVSEVTIRNDLRNLEDRGELIRTHGGAVARMDMTPALNSVRAGEAEGAKAAIARAACKLVNPGDWVFLGCGSTCLSLAKAFVGREVNVVTNNLMVALALSGSTKGQVIIPGGTLYDAPIPFLYGETFETPLATMSFDIAFLGVMGIDHDFGYSFSSTIESGIFAKVRRSAKQLAVVADSTKFGETSFRAIRDLATAETVITSGELSDEHRQWLQKAGVTLVEAPLK